MSEQEASLLDDVEVEIPRDPPETPEVKPEEKPEAKAPEKEPEKEKDDPDTKYRNVQKALKEERARAKAAEAEREQLRQRLAQQEEAVNAVREWREEQRRAREEAVRKEFEDNPAQALWKRQEEIRERLDKEEQTKAEREAEERQRTQFAHAISSAVNEFTKEAPDYQDAFKFVRETRYQEYSAMGYDAEEMVMVEGRPVRLYDAMFDQEAVGVAQAAFERGQNPAEIVYNFAKAKGYGAKPPETQKAEDVIEKLETAQKKNQSLKGAAATSSILKKIEEMSDEEFDKYWATEIKPGKIR